MEHLVYISTGLIDLFNPTQNPSRLCARQPAGQVSRDRPLFWTSGLSGRSAPTMCKPLSPGQWSKNCPNLPEFQEKGSLI